MAYRLGAPKRIIIGEIGFHVATPAGVFSAWKKQSRAVVQQGQVLGGLAAALTGLGNAAETATAGEEKQAVLADALQQATGLAAKFVKQVESMSKEEDDLFAQALAFVVGWDGVEDDEGKPVPFSPDALQQVDAAILEDLYLNVGEQAAQVQRAVESGN